MQHDAVRSVGAIVLFMGRFAVLFAALDSLMRCHCVLLLVVLSCSMVTMTV
jgi:hypothetical protein